MFFVGLFCGHIGNKIDEVWQQISPRDIWGAKILKDVKIL